MWTKYIIISPVEMYSSIRYGHIIGLKWKQICWWYTRENRQQGCISATLQGADIRIYGKWSQTESMAALLPNLHKKQREEKVV